MREVGRGAVVLGLACALMLPITGIAVAALSTVTSTEALGNGESETLSPECDPGEQAVSGGFSGPGLDPIGTEGPYVHIFASYPDDPGEWASQGFNGNPVEGDFNAFAYCTDALDDLNLSGHAEGILPGDTASADANCPTGDKVVSGGFGPGEPNFATGEFVYPFESRKLDANTWRVSAFNNDDVEREFESIALCTNENLGITDEADSIKKPNNKVVKSVASCPKGRTAISGGFDGMVTDERSTTLFEARRRGARTFQASAAAYTDDAKVKWRAFAYCVKSSKLDLD